MRFSEIIGPDQIVLDLQAKDRWEAIEKLVGYLVKQKRIAEPRHQAVIKAVKEREKSISTGIGLGVAIPHAQIEAIDKSIGVLARSPEGIHFDALDNQPAKLVVLFLSPSGQHQEHLKTLATVSRMVHNREFCHDALQAKTANEMYQLILNREG